MLGLACDNQLLRDPIDEVPEEVLDDRRNFPWKHNCIRWPQIFYFDRYGVGRYFRPLYEIEERRFCVWVIDEYGINRGVVGAVSD
jgi:hypothetical protein